MRLLVVLLILVFAALGALFGALNSAAITIDFYFLKVELPKGATLLATLLLGWLLGGILVWLSRVPRLRNELRRVRREAAQPPADAAVVPRESARHE